MKVIVCLVCMACALGGSAAYRRGELLWQTTFATRAEAEALQGTNRFYTVAPCSTASCGRYWLPGAGASGDGALYFKGGVHGAGLFAFPMPPKARGLIQIEADVKGVDIQHGPQPFNGPKIMYPYVLNGRKSFPQLPNEFGSFDWKTWIAVDRIPENVTDFVLCLGLEDAVGEMWLDAVRIYRAEEIADGAVTAPPNPRADALPRGRYKDAPNPLARRGVMSGNDMSEEAFQTLKAWNANLIRLQISVSTQDKEDDEAWFAGLEQQLVWADGVLARCRRHGIMAVIDLHGGPGTKKTKYASNVVPDDYDTANLRRAWRMIATRYREDPVIYGYDIMNEPACSPATWDRVFRETVAEIRTIDRKTPVITESFKYWYPNENVIYSPHYYSPHTLTHFGVGGRPAVRWSYNNYINGEFWNKDRIREALEPFIRFQIEHPGARVFVGEFSCILWSKGAADYINDCIELFDEYGWDWTYQAFREWPPWSVEYEHEPDYAVDRMHKATTDTDRKRALLKGLSHNRRH